MGGQQGNSKHAQPAESVTTSCGTAGAQPTLCTSGTHLPEGDADQMWLRVWKGLMSPIPVLSPVTFMLSSPVQLLLQRKPLQPFAPGPQGHSLYLLFPLSRTQRLTLGSPIPPQEGHCGRKGRPVQRGRA